MKRHSAHHFISVLATLAAALLLTDCGSRKRLTELELRAKYQQLLQSQSELSSQTVTMHYGDSLSGKGFIPTEGNKPLEIETSGIKVKLNLKPVKNDKGEVIGNDIEYEANAKPKGVTNQTVNANQKTSAEVSSESESSYKDYLKVIRSNWKVWAWIIGVIVLIALIRYLVKRFKIF